MTARNGRTLGWSTELLRDKVGLNQDPQPFNTQAITGLPERAVVGLTGSTGWLGRHLARALLRHRPNLQLVAPVRAGSLIQARKRFEQALIANPAMADEADRNAWLGRSTVMRIEDLADDQLRVSRNLDAVIHSAADLSLALDLNQSWRANVLGTQQAWAWAKAAGAARFDHISTLSVWVAGATPPGDVAEMDALMRSERLWGGYAASKWAAEAWLSSQREGPALAIHRMGLLSYSGEEGWCATDGLAMAGRSWKRWGRPDWAWSSGLERVDWTPVMRAASGVLAAMSQGQTGPFHWASEESVPGSTWLKLFEEAWGNSPGQWPQHGRLGKGATRAFGRWSDPVRASRYWWQDLFQSDRHRFNAERAQLLVPRWTWSEAELRLALAQL